MIRELNDPFQYLGINEQGGINIIDLANITSCAFIQTQDLGELVSEKEFKMIGRVDNKDLRGCALLLQE
jgi:hypothetical protein